MEGVRVRGKARDADWPARPRARDLEARSDGQTGAMRRRAGGALRSHLSATQAGAAGPHWGAPPSDAHCAQQPERAAPPGSGLTVWSNHASFPRHPAKGCVT
jgi:hypothetical protein